MLNASRVESVPPRVMGAGVFAANPDADAYVQARWYAAYTRANHERRVADLLLERGVENFLPQYESVRKWKDRRVRLQMPLFAGYVFVHLALQNRLKVLQVPGVAYLVGSGGLPTALPEREMEIMRSGLSQKLRAEPYPFL